MTLMMWLIPTQMRNNMINKHKVPVKLVITLVVVLAVVACVVFVNFFAVFPDSTIITFLKDSSSYDVTEISSKRMDDAYTKIICKTYKMKNKHTGREYSFGERQGQSKGIFGGLSNNMISTRYFFDSDDCSDSVGGLFEFEFGRFFYEKNKFEIKRIIDELGIETKDKKWYEKYNGNPIIAGTTQSEIVRRFFEEYRQLPEVEELYSAYYKNYKKNIDKYTSGHSGHYDLVFSYWFDEVSYDREMLLFDWAINQGIAPKL